MLQPPLELEHLKQQSQEQAQLLEVELKKQSEDQRQFLLAELKAQSVEHSKQLDEKLREQSEQLQQVAENLHLKIQRKGEEHVILEATMQEQASRTEAHNRHLAREVASMKATIEEVLKKLDRL